MALARRSSANRIGSFQRKIEAGTVHANIHDLVSVVPTSPTLTQNGWGGARNSADRVSTELTRKQVADTFAAAERAIRIGLPFNRFVTIHLAALGYADAKASAATRRYLKLASDYLRKNGFQSAWAYIRENDEGDGRKGSHVHIYLHWPDGPSFAAMQARWMRALAGKQPPRRSVLTRRIGGSTSAWRANPELYRANLAKVLDYGLKGAAEAVAALYGLGRHGEGGQIIGKRSGRSQNLGGGGLK